MYWLTDAFLPLAFATLVIFAIVRANAIRLNRLLPADTPEKLQQVWMQLTGSTWTGVLAAFVGLGTAAYVSAMSNRDPGSMFWRTSNFILIAWCPVAYLVYALAIQPFLIQLRRIGATSGAYIRSMFAMHLLMYGTAYASMFGSEVFRQFFYALPEAGGSFLAAGIGFCAFILAGVPVAPLMSMLLQDKRMKSGTHLEQVRELCAAARIKPLPLSVVPDKGDKIVLGLAFPKRVVISEYLIHQLEPDELKGLIGHEIGHIALGHHKKRSWIYMLSLFAGFFWMASTKNFYQQADEVLPLLALVMPLAVLLWTNRFRLKMYQRQELEADDFGAKLINNSSAMQSMLTRIHQLGSIPDVYPNGGKMLHPSLLQRLQHLQSSASSPVSLNI